MLIVVYIYETKKPGRVFRRFLLVFLFWLLLERQPPFERQPKKQKGHPKWNKRAQKTPLTLIFFVFFLEKVLPKSPNIHKNKKRTHALSPKHTRARALELREREREKNKAHGEKLSFAFLFTVVFVGFTRGGGGRARRRPSLKFAVIEIFHFPGRGRDANISWREKTNTRPARPKKKNKHAQREIKPLSIYI